MLLGPEEFHHARQFARESVSNAVRHSGASSIRVEVQQLVDDLVEVLVADDGCWQGAEDGREDALPHSLAMRAELLQGESWLQPSREGTVVGLRFRPASGREQKHLVRC